MVTQKLIEESPETRRPRNILTGRKVTSDYMCSKFYGQAERAISNGKLNVLLRFHIRPIKLVVFQCSSYLRWEISSQGRFRAYMHSALILTELRYPAMPLA